MGIWTILGIRQTFDKKEIKKAYHQKLRENHPEDNQTVFILVREAYEKALAMAEKGGHQQEAYEMHQAVDTAEYSQEADERRQQYLKWCQRVQEVYADYGKRNDTECWRRLLFDDIPYQIAFYEQCRSYIYYLCITSNSSIYIKREARLLIDAFFHYSASMPERVRSDNRKELQLICKRVQLCEKIEFDKLLPQEGSDKEIDAFCNVYEVLLEKMVAASGKENQMEELEQVVGYLEQRRITYLPFECIRIAMHFDSYTEDILKSRIEALQKRWNGAAEIQLLLAQYSIYKGEREEARMRLGKLYREAPAKNYALLYQMAHCCFGAGMYYEAYMLVKQLTWLNPKPFMNEMADAVYAEMEKEYLQKCGEEETVSDLEYIHMCRIYLRSNREEAALKALAKVKEPSKHQWEYELAHCLVLFYEEAKNVTCNLYSVYEQQEFEQEQVMEVPGAEPVIRFLEAYPKERLNSIERLEWEELQARYLFEQRRYSDCEEKCNALLEEYPLSYPILLLRGYADYNNRCFGSWSKMKEYMDFTFLIDAMPNRVEARLVSANILMFLNEFERAAEVLEPVNEKLPDHYAYYKLLRQKGRKEYFDGILKLFTKSRETVLSIPPVSKYRLLDLRNIYTEACYVGWSTWNDISQEYGEKYYDFLEAQKDAEYNHPEQYMTLFWFYFRTGRLKEAISEERKKLQNAKTGRERHNACDKLLRAYCEAKDMEEAEKAFALFSKESPSYDMMAKGHYRTGNYEKAVHYALLEKERCPTMDLYYYLGKAYACLQQYEEAASAFEEGIRLFDQSGDMEQFNFYFEIYKVYTEVKQWEKAMGALNDMRRYTCLEKMQSAYDEEVLVLCDNMLWEYQEREEENIADIEKVIAKIPREKSILRTYPFGILTAAYREAGKTDLAIDTAHRGIKASGGTGDYWETGNLYWDLYFIYQNEKQYESAFMEAKRMQLHSQLESKKSAAPCMLGYAAILMEDFETGYTYFKMVKENPSYDDMGIDIEMHIFLCNYGAGHYEELYEQAHKLTYAAGDENFCFLVLAFRCYFMVKGCVNRELGIQIQEEILKSLDTTDEKGYYLECLSEISMALGNTEEAKAYRNQVIQYYKEINQDDDSDFTELTGWCYAYQRQYEKAVQVWEQDPQFLGGLFANKDIEYAYFKKMSKINLGR